MSQASVTVYTMDHCPYCERAKRLLKDRGVAFEEVRVPEEDDAQWDALFKKSGMRTMPQIFAGSRLVGGYMQLAEQDAQDKLVSLKA
jgi:glutaredoxin 3